MDLVVIGSSNMDVVIKLPKIPVAGETVLGGKSEMIFGGKGANQAVAAARASGNVLFITKLGQDAFGKEMKEHFLQESLPAKGILSDEKEVTGIAQIFVEESGENCIAVAPGANGNLGIKDVEPFIEEIATAKIVLMQLEIPLSTVEYVVNKVAHKGVKVILNPAPAQKLPEELLSKLWMITPNETEAELLTGIKVGDQDSAVSAGESLLAMGVENALITLGENGSLLVNKSGSEHFSTPKV
ncbi:MAG: ribokinase, partial [Cytophagales bacterium]|nr:ribokinase [Cytophagales bacterium]